MRWYANEVAPAAPLLIPLAEILLWAIAFAVCIAVIYFTKAFFGVAGNLLGKLPIVGGWLDAGAHSIEQRITSTFAAAAASCDAKVGAALHSLARFVDKLGAEIVRHANLLLELAQLIPGAATIEGFVRDLLALRRLATSLVHRIEGVGHDVFGRIGHIERGIGADVLPRIRSLDKRIGRVIEHDIAGLRQRDAALEREYDKLTKLIRAHPWTVVTTAFVGAVAIALERLGGGWIRCRNWNRLGKSVCGTPIGDIEAILGLVVTGAVLADFRDLVKLAQTVEHGVAVGLQDIAKL